MVLSDISFDKKGVLEAADSGGSAGDVFGREGEHVLVNGRKAPVLRVRSGAPQRWRIVNTARSRFFLLDLQGQRFTVIGSDGGLQERPTTSDVLLVTPGERVERNRSQRHPGILDLRGIRVVVHDGVEIDLDAEAMRLID